MKLTAKQENFARLVSEGSTYSDAYRGSYNVRKNTSKNSIYVRSSELMDNSKVSVRIQELIEANKKRNEVSLDEVLQEMANWLRFDPIELMDDDDCVRSLKDMSANARKCLVSIEVTELFHYVDKIKTKYGDLKKLKFIDRRAVSDQFLKKLGAYVTNLNIKTDDISHLEDLIDGIKE